MSAQGTIYLFWSVVRQTQKIPWTEEPGRLQPMGSLESDTTERLHFPLSCIAEGNGNPLQCSCLENPRDGEAWWAAVYGVTQSRTRLKRLSSSSSNKQEGIPTEDTFILTIKLKEQLSHPIFLSPSVHQHASKKNTHIHTTASPPEAKYQT